MSTRASLVIILLLSLGLWAAIFGFVAYNGRTSATKNLAHIAPGEPGQVLVSGDVKNPWKWVYPKD